MTRLIHMHCPIACALTSSSHHPHNQRDGIHNAMSPATSYCRRVAPTLHDAGISEK